MASPRPRPWVAPPAWQNGSNTWGRKAALMPRPMSVTVSSARSAIWRRRTTTRPAGGVNLMALPTRYVTSHPIPRGSKPGATPPRRSNRLSTERRAGPSAAPRSLAGAFGPAGMAAGCADAAAPEAREQGRHTRRVGIPRGPEDATEGALLDADL